jgi:hypothetical protein
MFTGPNISTEGLVFAIDSANPKSYPGSGDVIYNLTPDYTSMTFIGNSSYGQIDSMAVHLSASGLADANGAILYCGETISTTLNSDFTTTGWMYRTVTNSAEVFSYRQSSYRLSFEITDSQMIFNQRETSTPYTINQTTVSVTNARDVWDHFALSKTGTSWSFYKNGEHLGTNTFTMTETVGGSGFHIGAAWSDDDYYGRGMNGRVGPVMHYTRALSADEILQNYNANKPRFTHLQYIQDLQEAGGA